MKWKTCRLHEAIWVPLNVHCPNVACEAQWHGEQQEPQPKHKNKVMDTQDDTKVGHTQHVDDWCKQVMHSITATHTLNGHKNDDNEDDNMKKEGQL